MVQTIPFLYYPEDKPTVIVLSNIDVESGAGIAFCLGALAHGENVQSNTQTTHIRFSTPIESASHPLPRPVYASHRPGEHRGWD